MSLPDYLGSQLLHLSESYLRINHSLQLGLHLRYPHHPHLLWYHSQNLVPHLDHYYYQQDWDKAIKALKVSINEFSDDGALNSLLASIYLLNGDDISAIKSIEYALSIEPDNEIMYWTGLSIYNSLGNFDEAVSMITALENEFLYEFEADNFRIDEEYSNFVTSEEFKSHFGE